jgi:hypothetical protein
MCTVGMGMLLCLTVELVSSVYTTASLHRLEAGSLKMNTALEYCTVQEWSRRGAVDVKRVLLTI